MIEILIMILFFIAITYGFGLLYMLISNYVSKWIQCNFGWKGFCIFGAIGVPFHELTHYLMCKIFLHKVTDVCLFRPKKGKEDNILGYVKHEYKLTRYRKMGNFFIGTAPMIIGMGLIILVFYLLYPNAFDLLEPVGFTLIGIKEMILNSFDFLIYILFSMNMLSWKYYVFLFILIAISSHIDMSMQDIKSTVNGLLPFIITSFSIIILIAIFSEITLKGMAGILFVVNIYYIYFLIICAIINIFIGTIFKILYKIKKRSAA